MIPLYVLVRFNSSLIDVTSKALVGFNTKLVEKFLFLIDTVLSIVSILDCPTKLSK